MTGTVGSSRSSWTLADWERRLCRGSGQPSHRFIEAEMEGLDGPVRRYLTHAIPPARRCTGADGSTCAAASSSGGGCRFVPARSSAPITVSCGRRFAGAIAGSDEYLDGTGGMNWKLGGLITVAHKEGPDVSRSAAGRGAAEAIWLPTTLLPRFGVRWTSQDDTHITAHYELRGTPWPCTTASAQMAASSPSSSTCGATRQDGKVGLAPLRRHHRPTHLRRPDNSQQRTARMALRNKPMAWQRVLPVQGHLGPNSAEHQRPRSVSRSPMRCRSELLDERVKITGSPQADPSRGSWQLGQSRTSPAEHRLVPRIQARLAGETEEWPQHSGDFTECVGMSGCVAAERKGTGQTPELCRPGR